MRFYSSAVSIGTHIGIATAALLGSARRPVSASPTLEPPVIIFPTRAPGPVQVPVIARPPILDLGSNWTPPSVNDPITLPQTSTTDRSAPRTIDSGMPASADASTGLSPFVETQPEVLSGPLPRYPDLLRQAGIEGRVVLEAIVDATGRVEAGSVVVAEATNPAFVGVARAALLATLFRPGAVNGRPVRVKVRIPYEFTLRNGTGRAR
jgi:periplasmic protein TonB